MKLRTELQSHKGDLSISYEDDLLFLGSCFADNIGEMVKARKFNANINPLGIAYNPISIFKNIERCIGNELVHKNELDQRNGSHFHYGFHGSNNRLNQEDYINDINTQIIAFGEKLKTANVVFISLGTANVFEHSEFGVVANCHKMPQELFKRRTLTFEEVKFSLIQLSEILRFNNSKIEIIFTVSPIRHVRDGLIKDRSSKSILIAAISEIIGDDHIHYFPSYEVLVDDLRDYRFYNEDLIHPNEMAIKYIWEIFSTIYFTPETKKTIAKIENILGSLAHRPINPNSENHKRFLFNLLDQLQSMKNLDFSNEVKDLQQKLNET